MKFGPRKPSIKKSLVSRTTGALTRAAKKALIPGYGRKGRGILSDPQKSLYNSTYNRTTTSIFHDTESSPRASTSSADVERQRPVTRINNNGPVRRDCQIMAECIELVNTSDNIDTVISRFDDLLDVLNRLRRYAQWELDDEGVSFPEPLDKKYNEVVGNKEKIINQAIDRAYHRAVADASKLKTDSGRHNRIMRFFENALQMSGLSQNNRTYLQNLRNKYMIQSGRVKKK